jgi:hypothetical protein
LIGVSNNVALNGKHDHAVQQRAQPHNCPFEDFFSANFIIAFIFVLFIINLSYPAPIKSMIRQKHNATLGCKRHFRFSSPKQVILQFPNNSINPDHALGFTDIGLPVENTLISLRRLHSLAFGFETGPSFLTSRRFSRVTRYRF